MARSLPPAVETQASQVVQASEAAGTAACGCGAWRQDRSSRSSWGTGVSSVGVAVYAFSHPQGLAFLCVAQAD
jgi:hypothetical protein